MSLQHFMTAASAISFPQICFAGTNLVTSTLQLRKLFFHAPAQKLVGVFTTATTDWNILGAGNPTIQANWRLNYLWRDGTAVDLTNATPLRGFQALQVQQTHTATGQVVQVAPGDNIATDELSAIEGDALYPLSEVWAGDIYPVKFASAAVLGQVYDASYLTTASAGYVVAASSTAIFRVLKKPSGSAVVSVGLAAVSGWDQARDMIYIDGKHTAITFMQVSGSTVDASSPARIRLFNTATDPWTLLWTDTLPGADSVACYDPVYEILYSTAKWPGSAVIHASKLKQSPASLSTVTLVSGTTLQEMRATQISVLVTDSQASGISGVVVCWTLSAATSGGSLLSAYTKTNASGIATATYIGPRLSGTTTTEFVSAAVATIDPVGV